MNQVVCPYCQAKIQYNPATAGKHTKCPGCSKIIALPPIIPVAQPPQPPASPVMAISIQPPSPRPAWIQSLLRPFPWILLSIWVLWAVVLFAWFVLDAIPKGEPAGNGAYVYNGQYVQPSAFIRMALVSTVFAAFILALPATIASVIAYFFCKKS